jgi:exopolysaccharide biosynthesis polyprenyl glycosylphosphotransferase
MSRYPREYGKMTSATPAEPALGTAYIGRLDSSVKTTALRGQANPLAWKRKLSITLALGDTAVVVVSLALAHLLRFGPTVDETLPDSRLAYTMIGVFLAAAWLIALAVTKSREQRILGLGIVEYRRVVTATLFTFGSMAIVALIINLDIARGYLGIAFPVGLVLLVLERYVARSVLLNRRRGGRMLTGALIVGGPADASRVMDLLGRNPAAGYRPIGVAYTASLDSFADPQERVGTVPSFEYDDLIDVVERSGVTAVIVAGHLPGGPEQIRELGWRLENSGVELVLVSKLTDIAGPRIYLRPIDGLPMVHVDLPQYAGVRHDAKRIVDVVLSSMALAALALPMLAIAIAIKLNDGGPVFFRQERIGLRAEKFTMFKFRSMVPDAEALKTSLAGENEGSGVLFKMRHDPRITRVGRVLRRYSLDELPQFINVFRGDMSLVGPRPPLAEEVSRYEERVTRRLLIKPGVTGLWQVSGRSRLSWEESVRLDLYYVENWSVIGDLIILMKTVKAVIGRDGAY